MKTNKLLLIPILTVSFAISACNGSNNSASCKSSVTNNSGSSNNCQCAESTPYYGDLVAPDGMFFLNLIDKENYVVNKDEIRSKYVPFETIYFYVDIIPDTHLFMFLDDHFYATPVVVERNGKEVWQYKFEMPTNSATIEFKKSSLDSIARNITVDYGLHVTDKATLLFGGMQIPDLSNLNVDKMIAGDYVTLTYDGVWIENMSYPSQLVMKDITIKDVSVVHGRVYLFQVLPVPGDAKKEIVQLASSDAGEFMSEYCINQDGTFAKLDTYPVNTILYGISPSNYDSNNIVAFYSYDPLA